MAATFRRRAASTESWGMAVVCLIGLAAAGYSALDLSAFGLARYLNSDFLTPYFFCLDLLRGKYPITGWTLSASPYFVPDHLLLTALLGFFNSSGRAYALFTLVFYPLLFVLQGLCVQNAVGRAGPAFITSLFFGNALLAWRVIPGHALYLWWLGAPCCHGGVWILGFAYLWVLGTGLRHNRAGWLPAALFGVALMGLCSDTLFLFQVLLPAVAALFVCRRRHPAFSRWFHWQNGCALAALAASQCFKAICHLAGWFYFSRMLRVAPTPTNQWHALGEFVSDLPQISRDGWGFALLAVLAGAWSLRAWRGWPARDAMNGAPPQAGGIHAGVVEFLCVFCVASLLIMLPLPIVTCAFRSANCVRYLLNWMVLPGFLLALATAQMWVSRGELAPGVCLPRWPAAFAGAAFLVLLGLAATTLRDESLEFPSPVDVAALDTLLQRRGLKYGLAQYWEAKYITALSHAGAELRQIREDGSPYFWDNNAFGYYAPDASGILEWPSYQYILLNKLDEQTLLRLFGEPAAKESAGKIQVWIYSDEGQRKIQNVLENMVRQKLGPKRLQLLHETGPL